MADVGCIWPKGLGGQVLEWVVSGLGERQREAERGHWQQTRDGENKRRAMWLRTGVNGCGIQLPIYIQSSDYILQPMRQLHGTVLSRDWLCGLG